MVISVILDTEYMGVAERNKWFLKSVSNALKEDTLIVTHSYFKEHLEEIVEGCADRFYPEFEMDRVSIDKIRELDICFIPDDLFDEIYEESGSRTKQLLKLYNERNKPIEDYIISFVEKSLKKRKKERPSCIFNCLHTFASIKYLAEYFKCPLIPYVFSAVRKVHGYLQTLYMAHIGEDLFNSDACQQLYEQKTDFELGFPIFNKYEILALLGKKHNMPLIPLLERKGIYEVGVVGEGFHITPEIYQKDAVTDDDIYYECKRWFPKESIVTRQHPMQLDQAGFGREHMKNDPAAFILSSKRIVTVQSQMIMKAAMWNRSAVAMSKALPYACLLNKDLENERPISDYDLNFILFVYFVPNSCMFDSSYWEWRSRGPMIKEIASRHIKAIISEIGMTLDQIMKKENRLETIMKNRGFSNNEINKILYPGSVSSVSYSYPTSCLKCVKKDGSSISLFSLNYGEGNLLSTSFEIPLGTVRCDFIPQNDLDGYIKVNKARVSSITLDIDGGEKYYKKNEPVLSFEVNEKDREFESSWLIRKFG